MRLAVRILAVAAAASALQAQPPAAKTASEQLAELNAASRAAYRRARAEFVETAGPVILAAGDTLTLRHKGLRVTETLPLVRYTTLKSFAHVPLAAHALFVHAAADGALTGPQVKAAREYRAEVAGAVALADQVGLTAEEAGRQRQLLAASLEFIDGVTAAGRCPPAELTAYCRRMRPLVMANADAAAREQIDQLRAVVGRWRKLLTDDEWGRLRVVVQGAQTPRKDNLAVQFFARLLGEPGEGGRVVYAESLWDEQKALELMGTRLLDGRVGKDFFDDGERMFRDLLADAARAALDR